MTKQRSLAVWTLVLVLATAVAGCGGEPFPGPNGRASNASVTPRARLLAAARRANEASTARIALHESFSLRGGAGMTFSGAGVIDLAHGRMRLTMQTQGDGGTTSIEMRVVDRTAYIEHDGSWTSVSLAGAGAANAIPDPTSYMDFLQGVADDVHVDGRETLRGDDTTRYRATLDLARAVATAGASMNASQRVVLRDAVAMLGDLRMPVTVWVDDVGRLRKLSISMDLSAAAGRLGISSGVDPKVEATMELYDFGVPVDVVAPGS